MKKKVLLIIMSLILAITMVGCDDDSVDNKEKDYQSSVQGLEDIEKATKEEEEKQEKKDIQIKEKEEEKLEKQEPPEVSSKWTDLEFGFENSKYKIPFSVKDLLSKGWNVDFSETDYDEYSDISSSEKLAANFNLTNEKYDDKIQVKVGFYNSSDEKKDILDTSIWSFDCSIMYGFKKLKKYPVMTLSKDITWGSSEKEIKSVFKEPDTVFKSKEHGYKKLSYKKDNIGMDLIVYDKDGLMGISLRKF